MLDRFLVSGDPRQFHNSDAAARVRQSMLKMIFALAGSGEFCGHRGGSSRMSGGSGFGQDAIHAGDT